MQASTVQPEEEFEDYSDEESPYDMNDIPITKDIQLDNKIISTAAKNKIVISTPKIEKKKVGIPAFDKNGLMVTKKVQTKSGLIEVPILLKVKSVEIITGFDTKEVDFPISDWFNDSVTSGILEKDEARYLRRVDDVGFKLMSKMVLFPKKVAVLGFLQRLAAQKQSIADTSKGIGGGAIEHAKTNITRSEMTSYLYRKDREDLAQVRARQAELDKGMLGLGYKVPILGFKV